MASSGLRLQTLGVMDETDLSAEQLQKLAELLVNKREELSGLVASLGEVTGTKHDCAILDLADSASLHEMQRRAATLQQQHGDTINEIDAALARMRDGRYGISETTGEPIPFERLQLIPWARTGVDEQS